MDTQVLMTFVALAEYRNFTKTADSLFISQSTVTNRIFDLERETGKQLFERNKRKVTLTEEGETFLNYAKRIIELSNAGIQDINSLNKYPETLRIGTTNTIYKCHLFPKIKEYIKTHPENAVKITISHSINLIQAIQDNLYDAFPPHFQFKFEIDNSTKLIPYLIEFNGISFIPESIAKIHIGSGQLQSIKLIDFDAPKINCYKIYRTNKANFI